MIEISVVVLILIFIYLYDYKKVRIYKKTSCYVILALLILMAGLSYRLGFDSTIYFSREYGHYPTFNSASLSKIIHTEGRQPGWMLFTVTCKTLGFSYSFMKFLIAIIFNLSVFYLIKTHTKYLFTGLLLYVVIKYWYFNYEIIRQSLAMSFFFVSLPFLEKKKYTKYLMCLFVAFMFHESAAVFLILPIVVKIGFSKKTLFLHLVVIAVLLLSVRFLSDIPYLLLETDFHDKAEVYLSKETFGKSKVFQISNMINYFLHLFFPIIIMMFMMEKRIRFKTYYYIVPYSYLCVIAYIFPILFRLNCFLEILYFIFYIDIIIFFGKEFRIKQLFVPIVSLLFIVLHTYNMFIPSARYGGMASYHRYYPYSSIIEESKDRDRETLYYYLMSN